MHNKIVICLVLPILLQFLSGCATITRGSKDVLVVNSDPPGATVTTSIGLSGKTPASFKVSRKEGFTVKIEKPGYEPAEIQVQTRVKGGAQAMAGNILFGGLIGVAVDSSTGATKDLVPNPIEVKLAPIKSIPGNNKSSDKPESGGEVEEPLSFKIEFKPLSDGFMLLSVSSV